MTTASRGATVGGLSRRGWLRAAAGGVSGVFIGDAARAAPQAAKAGKPIRIKVGKPIEIKDSDIADVEKKLEQAGIDRVHRLSSTHYQAIGDAAEVFMKSTLIDCEQLAVEFLKHFKARGFDVHAPERTLILLVFRDDRSFGRYFQIPSLPEAASKGIGAQMTGAYDRSTNLLNLFDWRNVPMASRSPHRNTHTIAHEGTHQLTFNTGLLERSSDIPVAIVEGLGTYGEPRKVMGPSELGRINLRRLDDLAKLRRVERWIPLHDLILNDSILREGLVSRVSLAYAQSWLLVHFLMNDEEFALRFRHYLNIVRGRKTPEHRLDDAKTHLGDLDALDGALKAYSIRLLRTM